MRQKRNTSSRRTGGRPDTLERAQALPFLRLLGILLPMLALLTACPPNSLLQIVQQEVRDYQNGNKGTVDVPQFSLSEGTYSSDQTISIATSTEGATIYYTTDGTTPTKSSLTYALPIPVSGNNTVKTIKAFAAQAGMNDSAVASATYTIDYTKVSTPQFVLPEGTYSSDQTVEITDNTSGAIIYYTTDDSIPTESSILYGGAIPLPGPSKTWIVKAIATKTGMATSTVAKATYTILYQYTLTVDRSTGGTTSPAVAISVSHGAATSIAATHDADHLLLNWTVTNGTGATFGSTGTSTSTAVSDTVTLIAGPATIRANFAPTIITVAGGGSIGAPWSDGGPATSAQLQNPMGIAVDNGGNLFIADSNRIRRVDNSGIITTVAGGGVGGDGGLATDAGLSGCGGVSVSWNLLIAEQLFSRIRWVDNDGIIRTVAGNGSNGFSGDGGLAWNAQLFSPFGVILDGPGNMFISDSNNNLIRKVDLSNVITTFAGSVVAGIPHSGYFGDGGQATLAGLTLPQGIALDSAGNLYIADTGNHCVRKVSPSGDNISTVAGVGLAGGFSGDDGPATAAKLNYPYAVALDSSGNLYIADTNNSRIRKLDKTSGVITTVVGNGIGGYNGDNIIATMAEICSPMGIAFDSSGYLYIADNANLRIRRVKQ